MVRRLPPKSVRPDPLNDVAARNHSRLMLALLVLMAVMGLSLSSSLFIDPVQKQVAFSLQAQQTADYSQDARAQVLPEISLNVIVDILQDQQSFSPTEIKNINATIIAALETPVPSATPQPDNYPKLPSPTPSALATTQATPTSLPPSETPLPDTPTLAPTDTPLPSPTLAPTATLRPTWTLTVTPVPNTPTPIPTTSLPPDTDTPAPTATLIPVDTPTLIPP